MTQFVCFQLCKLLLLGLILQLEQLTRESESSVLLAELKIDTLPPVLRYSTKVLGDALFFVLQLGTIEKLMVKQLLWACLDVVSSNKTIEM